MLRAIQMRTEPHTLVGNFAQIGKTEDLKTAGIRKDRMRPRHKRMKAAKLPNQFVAGTKIKMISVREDDFRAELFKRLLRQALHRRRSANGHKRRRMNHAMRRSQTSKPRPARISLQNFKAKSHPTNCISCARDRSGERPDPANFAERPDCPTYRDDRDPFADRNFLGACGGKTDSHQHNLPECEEVQ